jgi:hypothetical protein
VQLVHYPLRTYDFGPQVQVDPTRYYPTEEQTILEQAVLLLVNSYFYLQRSQVVAFEQTTQLATLQLDDISWHTEFNR